MNELLFSESPQLPPLPLLSWIEGMPTGEAVEYLWTWNCYYYPPYSAEVWKPVKKLSTKQKGPKNTLDTKTNPHRIISCSFMKLPLLRRKVQQWIRSIKHHICSRTNGNDKRIAT